MAELVAVKGIGEWTAHMFLMSHLTAPTCWPPATSASAARSNAPTAWRRSPTARRSSASPSAGGRTARSPAAICGARLNNEAVGASTEQPKRASLRQTAETCSSSATRNEEPQPQAATTLGFSTLKPAPWRLSS